MISDYRNYKFHKKVTNRVSTYEDLQPDAIVLSTEKPDIIVKRRKDRDSITIDINSTKEFQEAEIEYAKEIAYRLQIPLFISSGAADIEKAMEFVINNI